MNKLRIMSYNVWFDLYERELRTASLINIINDYNPDVICLQEVVPQVFKILKKYLSTTYKHIFPKNFDCSYGCVIISKYDVSHYNEYEYQRSMMGRKLCCAVIDYMFHQDHEEYRVDPQKIVICTSHFESEFKKNNETKIAQYNEAQQILEELYNEYGPVILCSDTNILEHEEKYFFSDSKWADTWIQNGQNINNSYTYDTNKNVLLIKRNIQKEIRSRIDRIIYRGNFVLKSTDFDMVKSQENMTEASDHFGIISTFSLLDTRIQI